jgi:hypothetical protein
MKYIQMAKDYCELKAKKMPAPIIVDTKNIFNPEDI